MTFPLGIDPEEAFFLFLAQAIHNALEIRYRHASVVNGAWYRSRAADHPIDRKMDMLGIFGAAIFGLVCAVGSVFHAGWLGAWAGLAVPDAARHSIMGLFRLRSQALRWFALSSLPLAVYLLWRGAFGGWFAWGVAVAFLLMWVKTENTRVDR